MHVAILTYLHLHSYLQSSSNTHTHTHYILGSYPLHFVFCFNSSRWFFLYNFTFIILQFSVIPKIYLSWLKKNEYFYLYHLYVCLCFRNVLFVSFIMLLLLLLPCSSTYTSTPCISHCFHYAQIKLNPRQSHRFIQNLKTFSIQN